jgi:hypothetical protein
VRVQQQPLSLCEQEETVVVELLGNARSITGDKSPKCVDCMHHKLYPPDPVLLYSSPKHRCTAAIDLVTGKPIETDCYAMRHRWVECGPDARLFDAKETPSPVDPGEEKAPPPLRANRFMGLLVGLGILAILLALAFWRYEQEASQPRVIKTGEVSIKQVSVKDGSCCVTARTHLLDSGKRSLWQVEVSPGDWRDCGDNCEMALRRTLAE